MIAGNGALDSVLLSSAIEAVSEGVLVVGLDARILLCNARFREIWRIPDGLMGELVTADALRARMPALKNHAEFLARTQAMYADPAAEGLDLVELVDGRFFERHTRPVRVDGAIVARLWAYRDITDQTTAAQALRRSEASFRNLIEQSPDAIVVHRDGRFVYVNRALCASLGYDRPDQLLGRPIADIVHPDSRAQVVARIGAMLQTGKPAPPAEERYLHRDGSTVTAEVSGLQVDFEGKPAFVALARDVTERRKLEAQLIQTERTTALGTLAAGVGHEINNPLTYVVANLELIGDAVRDRQPDAHDEIERCVREAQQGAERIRLVVSELRTFVRPERDSLGPICVEAVAESACRMAWTEIRHRARLVRELHPVPAVHGNGSRLGQVVLNLLINAAHAIPEGRAETNEIRVTTSVQSDRVCIAVADSGTGIPAEHLSRIFDPFFTTKPMEQGTGLGLFISQAIVRAMGGSIEVDSAPGHGSTFRVWLPPAPVQVGEASVPETPRSSSPAAGPTGARRGRLVVIDDDVLVGKALRRILAREHEVEVFTGGRDALERLLSGETPAPDVVFCDLMMPDMTGMELHAELLARRPQLADRMVFLTGGAFTATARDFVKKVKLPCLGKPFDREQVRQLVQERLARTHPATSS